MLCSERTGICQPMRRALLLLSISEIRSYGSSTDLDWRRPMAGKSETACKLTNSVPMVAVYIATSLSPCSPWISTSVAATDVFRGYEVAIPTSFFS